MLRWLGLALAVTVGSAILGLLAIVVEMVLFSLIWGGNVGAGLAVFGEWLPTLVLAALIASFLLVLVVLWPASLALRRSSFEQSQIYMTIGALVGVGLGLAIGTEEGGVDGLGAIWFATWGAITGALFWFAFRRNAPARRLATAPPIG